MIDNPLRIYTAKQLAEAHHFYSLSPDNKQASALTHEIWLEAHRRCYPDFDVYFTHLIKIGVRAKRFAQLKQLNIV